MTSTNFKITTIVQSDLKTTETLKKYFIKEGVRYYKENEKKGLDMFIIFIFEHQHFVNDLQDKEDIIQTIFLRS